MFTRFFVNINMNYNSYSVFTILIATKHYRFCFIS